VGLYPCLTPPEVHLVRVVEADQVVNGNTALAIINAGAVSIVHQFLEVCHVCRLLLQGARMRTQRTVFGVHSGNIDNVTRIDVKVHAPWPGLAGDAAGVRIRGLKLKGIDTADHHTVQGIALGIKGVNIDVMVADFASVFVDLQHTLHGYIEEEPILRSRCGRRRLAHLGRHRRHASRRS
jgi:hypothetical protein